MRKFSSDGEGLEVGEEPSAAHLHPTGRRLSLSSSQPSEDMTKPYSRLSCAVMEQLVRDKLLKEGWGTRAHDHLDFSDPAVFQLKTFTPKGFTWGKASTGKNRDGNSPIEHQVPVHKLYSLNLTNNKLEDREFDEDIETHVKFRSLKILRMKQNLLKNPSIMILPGLKELYLSHNEITRIPPLTHVRDLEVLDLSHNRIIRLHFTTGHGQDRRETTSEAVPKKLTVLNLSSNRIELESSKDVKGKQRERKRLFGFVKELGTLINSAPDLVNLQLKDNPFCAYFSEYQLLIARFLTKTDRRTFKRLDDLQFNASDGKVDPKLTALAEQAHEFFGREFDGPEKLITTFTDAPRDWKEDFLRKKGLQLKDEDQARKYFFGDRIEELEEVVERRRTELEELSKKANDARETSVQGTARSTAASSLGDPLAVEQGRKETPTITELTQALDAVLEDPGSALASVKRVMNSANAIAELTDTKSIFGDISSQEKNEAVANFVQQITLVAERHEETLPLVIRSLARFTCVPDHRMGELALTALGTMAKANPETETNVMTVVEEVVLPMLLDVQTDEDPRASGIIIGLSRFDCKDMARSLAYVYPKLCNLAMATCRRLKSMDSGAPGQGQGQKTVEKVNALHAAISKLLKVGAQDEENAKTLFDKQDLISSMAEEFMRREKFLDNTKCNSAVMWMEIVLQLLRHRPEDTCKLFTSKDYSMHRKLTTHIMECFGGGYGGASARSREAGSPRGESARDPMMKDTEDMALAQNKKISKAIELLVNMMIFQSMILDDKRYDNGEDETNRTYKERSSIADAVLYTKDVNLFECMLWCAKEDSADPMVLTSCLQGLTYIVRHPEYRKEHSTNIINALKLQRSENLILPYIDRKKFKDLYLKCEQHTAYTEGEQDEHRAKVTSVPDFVGATNPIAHQALVSVVNFLQAFTDLRDDEPEFKTCSEEMKRQGRDLKLFKLLEVPSDDVKKHVLHCVRSIKPEDFQQEDILTLVDMLRSERVSKEEQLLSQVIKMLNKVIIQNESHRSRHGTWVLKKVWDILAENTKRKTYGNKDEEQQKRILSVAAVELIATATRQDANLRGILRNQAYVGRFPAILKYEEMEHAYDTEDVCLELTWTGRHLPYLFQCLSRSDQENRDALDVNKKQAFRVFNRIADVLIGQKLSSKEFRHVQSTERAELEAAWWSDAQLLRRVSTLDDACHTDRMEQQQHFANFNGIERLVRFLETARNKNLHRTADRVEVDPESEVALMQKSAQEFLTNAHSPPFDDGLGSMVPAFPDDADAVEKEPMAAARHLHSMFMKEAWKVPGEQPQSSKSFTLAQVPAKISRWMDFFIPGTQGMVALAYPLAALLRAIYAMLKVPALDTYRETIICQLREHALQARLVGLVERCHSYLDCNVAAKLLRVMSVALGLVPGQYKVTNRKHLIGALVFAEFAAKIMKLIGPLLASLGSVTQLTCRQHLLAQECLRMLAHASTVAVHVQATGAVASQSQKVAERILERMWTPEAVRNAFMAMLYDMQAAQGSLHGSHITAEYARDSQGSADVTILVSELMGLISAGMPKAKRYDVLSLFNEFTEIGKHRISPTCPADIIDQERMWQVRRRLGDLLRLRPPKHSSGEERVVHTAYIEMPHERGGWNLSTRTHGTGPRMLVVTNMRVLIMGRARHEVLEEPCGRCPDGSFCPVAAEIEREDAYDNLTRIIVGDDPQLLILGWIRSPKQVESFEFIIFQRSDLRSRIIAAISALSSPLYEKRVKACAEQLIAEALHRRMASTIVCRAFAMIKSTLAVGKDPATAQVTGEESLSLIVLSEVEFCDFQVQFAAWVDAETPMHHFEAPVFDHVEARGEDPMDAPGGGKSHDRNAKKERQKIRDQEVRLQNRVGQAMALMRSGINAVRGEGAGEEAVEDGGDNARKSQAAIEMREDWPATLWANMTEKQLDDAFAKITEKRHTAIKNTKQAVLDAYRASAGGGLPAPCLGFGRQAAASRGPQKDWIDVMADRRKGVFAQGTKGEPLTKLLRIEYEGGHIPSLRLVFHQHKTREEAAREAKAGNLNMRIINIRFFDCHARETMRRALSLVLCRADASTMWSRGWENADAASK